MIATGSNGASLRSVRSAQVGEMDLHQSSNEYMKALREGDSRHLEWRRDSSSTSSTEATSVQRRDCTAAKPLRRFDPPEPSHKPSCTSLQTSHADAAVSPVVSQERDLLRFKLFAGPLQETFVHVDLSRRSLRRKGGRFGVRRVGRSVQRRWVCRFGTRCHSTGHALRTRRLGCQPVCRSKQLTGIERHFFRGLLSTVRHFEE